MVTSNRKVIHFGDNWYLHKHVQVAFHAHATQLAPVTFHMIGGMCSYCDERLPKKTLKRMMVFHKIRSI